MSALSSIKYNKEDILFEDEDVCILRPELKKGILIFHRFYNSVNLNSGDIICKEGLKSGKQLNNEDIKFGRNIYHPYIFFRAPYYNNNINYDSVEKEIESLYGSDFDKTSTSFIRVDPDKTFVYSSEIRSGTQPERIYESRKSMREYLRILTHNLEYQNSNPINPSKHKWLYNLISSEVKNTPYDINYKKNELLPFPLSDENINTTSEVLVRMRHIPIDYFVRCIGLSLKPYSSNIFRKILGNMSRPVLQGGNNRKYNKLEHLTVKELQEYCIKQKIPYGGKRKAELIAALYKNEKM